MKNTEEESVSDFVHYTKQEVSSAQQFLENQQKQKQAEFEKVRLCHFIYFLNV